MSNACNISNTCFSGRMIFIGWFLLTVFWGNLEVLKCIVRPNLIGEIVIFYTDILMRKVVLWCFFMSGSSEKIIKFNFSSQNLSIEPKFFK